MSSRNLANPACTESADLPWAAYYKATVCLGAAYAVVTKTFGWHRLDLEMYVVLFKALLSSYLHCKHDVYHSMPRCYLCQLANHRDNRTTLVMTRRMPVRTFSSVAGVGQNKSFKDSKVLFAWRRASFTCSFVCTPPWGEGREARLLASGVTSSLLWRHEVWNSLLSSLVGPPPPSPLHLHLLK